MPRLRNTTLQGHMNSLEVLAAIAGIGLGLAILGLIVLFS
jgi:hypothetical protein